MGNKKQTKQGKLPKLWDMLIYLHKEKPSVFDQGAQYLKMIVAQKWDALNDSAHCPNCGENMTEYIHRLDFFNALLLKQMGDMVKAKLKKGMSLERANAVHVVSQDLHDCVRHRTTQCRTLGLIAKIKNADGKHDRAKGWLITKRGFAALRGEPVQAEVTVFRNSIEERTDEKITLDEVFASYKGKHESLVDDRDPMEWVNFGNLNQNTLL